MGHWFPFAAFTVLDPGVYEWIEVVSGRVTFNPGVYIVRNVHPVTGIALNIVAGEVTAEGAMFYITNSASYTPLTGLPDANDGLAAPAAPGVGTLVPSVVLNLSLLGSRYSPLDDPASPFHGLTIYQRRADRRPIVLADPALLGAGAFSGGVYAKWGHVIFAGSGSYDATLVTGTLRIVAAGNIALNPTSPLPPAQDVFLVE